jgi:hypothetical protein
MAGRPPPAAAEQVLSMRKTPSGPGQQYEIKWQGQKETTWEAASRVRRQVPELVRAFEEMQQQHAANDGAAEGADREGEAISDGPPAGEAIAADGSSMRAQMEAMQRLLREQAHQLQQMRASPAHSPQQSPQLSPQQEQRHVSAPAAASVPAPPAARRKEPRLSDLAEYNGASGDKLDAWLAELRRCARYYQLSGHEAVEFAVARLRDSADTWWATLDSSAQAAITSVETLAAALRARFQPVTTARVAREKLHALQQGARHIDDYIAEFSKLHAQVPDMAEPDARAQFVRGLRRELAVKLEDVDWETMPLAAVVAKAARVGGRATAAQPAAGRVTVHQMEIDDGNGATSLDERITKAVLNAMQAQQGGMPGMGAKTQTHRGYANERAGAPGRGGFRTGRGGRFGGRGGGFASYTIPGVPSAVVDQRRAAGQCLRCGSSEHRGMECPNAPSATQPSN